MDSKFYHKLAHHLKEQAENLADKAEMEVNNNATAQTIMAASLTLAGLSEALYDALDESR